MKNVCQTCVFDLEYGLPVAVRDHALSLKDDIPTGDFNKEHFHENLGKELALQGDDLRGAHSAPNAFLERLSGTFLYFYRSFIIKVDALRVLSIYFISYKLCYFHIKTVKAGRRGPYYKRNLPHICSFWVKVNSASIKGLISLYIFRANVAVVKNARTATRNLLIQMIHYQNKILSIVFMVLKILLLTNFSGELNSFLRSSLQMIRL